MEAINIITDAREAIFQCPYLPLFVAYRHISARLGMYFYYIGVSIAAKASTFT
jgi:hypothetical protein